MSASQEIHDMIQCFDLGGSPERVASQLLDIAAALNRRMDEIEAANQPASAPPTPTAESHT